MNDTPDDAPPQARIVRSRRWTWAWIVPLAVLAVLVALGVQAARERPLTIRIRFPEGEGLRPGDPVACKGVQVGEVAQVRLAADAQAVLVQIELARSAESLAVEGTRFWIVHPEVSLRGVSGLDTLLGPRTIGVEPGPLGGPRTTSFVGLDRAPPLAAPTDGSLLLTLRSARRWSLSPGTPITYRDIPVGQVLDSRLAEDATGVDITVAIEPAYAVLVRDNSRFFNASGVTAEVGFSGITFRADTLESVITGGIALATPNKPGQRVANGHNFELAERAESEWTEWKPQIPLHESPNGG